MASLSYQTEALWRDAERALAHRRRPEAVVPILERLIQTAPANSEPWGWAHVQLAAHVVESDPWQAALWARRAVTVRADDARAWGVLGLACSLLGHFRAATHAYEEALRLSPRDARCAHNLGHVYDVVFDDFEQAVPLLERAVKLLGDDAPRVARHEAVSSLAHALLRQGDVERAYRTMQPVVRGGPTPAQHELYRQILDHRETLVEAVAAAQPLPPRRPIRRRRRTDALPGGAPPEADEECS